MKVLSLTIYDSAEPNRKSIITTKIFSFLQTKHSSISVSFITGLSLRTVINDDHYKLKKNILCNECHFPVNLSRGKLDYPL